MTRAGNWNEKKPDIGERLASRLSTHSSLSETLGGLPEFTTADFAAALGLLDNKLYQLLLGARFAGWITEQDQLREAALRHAWARWHDKKRHGNMSGPLNSRLVDLALIEWCNKPDKRALTSDAYRAKLLCVGYRRYKEGLEAHYTELLSWLDMETANALNAVAKRLRRRF